MEYCKPLTTPLGSPNRIANQLRLDVVHATVIEPCAVTAGPNARYEPMLIFDAAEVCNEQEPEGTETLGVSAPLAVVVAGLFGRPSARYLTVINEGSL